MFPFLNILPTASCFSRHSFQTIGFYFSVFSQCNSNYSLVYTSTGWRKQEIPLAFNVWKSRRLYFYQRPRSCEQVSVEEGTICCGTIDIRTKQGWKLSPESVHWEVFKSNVRIPTFASRLSEGSLGEGLEKYVGQHLIGIAALQSCIHV